MTTLAQESVTMNNHQEGVRLFLRVRVRGSVTMNNHQEGASLSYHALSYHEQSPGRGPSFP